MRRDDTNFHMLDTTARVKHFKNDKLEGFGAQMHVAYMLKPGQH